MCSAQKRIPRVLSVCMLVAALMLAPGATFVRAGGVVGNGTLTSCTEAAFDAALVGGGSVSFNCGPGPYTILITSQKSINLNTTIDGGGKITLDGQNAHRLFDVGAVLTLRNIVLTRGSFNGDGGAIRNNSNGTLVRFQPFQRYILRFVFQYRAQSRARPAHRQRWADEDAHAAARQPGD
jgi:hypothetical protein